jgi:hypothetical protein
VLELSIFDGLRFDGQMIHRPHRLCYARIIWRFGSMKAQSATLAIAALVLWLVPSGSLAQGNSGKSRLTICHIPPGNPDGAHTMTVSEQAWRAHESHGDYLGPCDEYGDDKKRAKKGKKGKKKGGKKARSGSDGDDVYDDIEVGDRADEGEEVDEADTRTRREKRQAERRARREQSVRDRDGKAADDGEAEAGGGDAGTDDTRAAQRRARREARAERRAATSGDAEEAEAGGADTGTDDTQADRRRARRKARADRRAAQAAAPDAETEDPPEEEQGFFRGMRQFFGFDGDEGEE